MNNKNNNDEKYLKYYRYAIKEFKIANSKINSCNSCNNDVDKDYHSSCDGDKFLKSRKIELCNDLAYAFNFLTTFSIEFMYNYTIKINKNREEIIKLKDYCFLENYDFGGIEKKAEFDKIYSIWSFMNGKNTYYENILSCLGMIDLIKSQLNVNSNIENIKNKNSIMNTNTNILSYQINTNYILFLNAVKTFLETIKRSDLYYKNNDSNINKNSQLTLDYHISNLTNIFNNFKSIVEYYFNM